jgi:hypothetical protein
MPVAIRAILRGKITPKLALFGHKIPKDDLKAVQAIYDKVENRPERYELNLYIVGEDEEPVAEVPVAAGVVAEEASDPDRVAAGAQDGAEGAASAPGPEGASTADPVSGDEGAERSAPAGESIAESSPPPVDPGPPAATGTEGEPPVEEVGPGSEPAPEEAAGEGEEATGDTAHQSGSTPEESES